MGDRLARSQQHEPPPGCARHIVFLTTPPCSYVHHLRRDKFVLCRLPYVFFVDRSPTLLVHRGGETLWVGWLWSAGQAHVAGTVRVSWSTVAISLPSSDLSHTCTQGVPLRHTGVAIRRAQHRGATREALLPVYSSFPATFVWVRMARTIFAIMPAHVRRGESHGHRARGVGRGGGRAPQGRRFTSGPSWCRTPCWGG